MDDRSNILDKIPRINTQQYTQSLRTQSKKKKKKKEKGKGKSTKQNRVLDSIGS